MPNMTTHPKALRYTGYKGLPPLVGLMSMKEAAERGLTVEESVARLKRTHWLLRRLHEIFVFRLAAMPVYELKMAFSLHLHYCAEHIMAVQERVREMREPPYGLDKSPGPAIDLLFDEIKFAPSVEALVLGLYEKAVPALVAGIREQLKSTSPLFDHPTHRVCRHLLVEMEDVAAYGHKAVECLVDAKARAELAGWLKLLDACLEAGGGLDGTGAHTPVTAAPVYSAQPFPFQREPQRDERFKDLFNQGVNAEAFLLDPERPALPKVLMMYFKRMREIDVPEMMSSILTETPDKPWKYYKEMSRQLWDEARHSMMGEIGFVATGVDWHDIPFTHNWSRGLNTKLTPLERHAVLFFIEQGLMHNKTGKKAEWEVAVHAACPLSQRIQDYDWADEILHARIGRDWLVATFGSQQQALEVGDKAWAKILTNWKELKEQGLTEHRNWWPNVYRQACKNWGIEPDPAVEAYDTSYEESRADLKSVY
jgi:hypothetical protein